MTNRVVTAHIRALGYRSQISQEMSVARAREFKRRIVRDMDIATPENQWCSDIRIERVV